MARKNTRNPLAGAIDPQVIAMAGLERFDTARNRRRIREKYGRNYHPAPVIFAELFSHWSHLSEGEKRDHLLLAQSDPAAAAASRIGRQLRGGIHQLREQFRTACDWSAVMGDTEFFRVFHEVSAILAKDDSGVSFGSLVLRTWDFLMLVPRFDEETDKGRRTVIQRAGNAPTCREILDVIESNHRGRVSALGDPRRTISDALRRAGLKPCPSKRGRKTGN